MAWIWSDELAAAAEAAGLEHSEIAAWRRQPVAFALHTGQPADVLARALLGIEPPAAGAVPPAGSTATVAPSDDQPAVCPCAIGEAAESVLAPQTSTR